MNGLNWIHAPPFRLPRLLARTDEASRSAIGRRPRHLELPPAGHALLLQYCREVGAADRRLQQRLSGDAAQHGEIAPDLISPGSIGLALYPRLLDLQQAHSGLYVRHRFAPTPDVIDAVLENRFERGGSRPNQTIRAWRYASSPKSRWSW